MRVDDSPPVSNRKNDDNDSRQKTVKDEHSFSKVLSKKRDADGDEAQAGSGKPSEKEFDPAAAGLLQAQTGTNSSFAAEQVKSSHAVSLPPDLQQLVREMSVAVTTAGQQQVHVELNSNVLKGLHIVIERRAGEVAIQFQSTSEQVKSLLARNIDSLTQGLAERGMEGAHIDIRGPEQSSRSQGFGARSGSGAQAQRGGQRGGR